MDEIDQQAAAFPDGGTVREWPSDQFLPTFESPDHLDVIDTRGFAPERRLFLTTLQGAVNGTRPRLYLISDCEEGPLTWLPELDVDYTFREDVDAVVEEYVDDVPQMIVYDPDVLDTVNLATTIAAAEGGVVAGADRAESLADEYDLDVTDLRGEFEDANEVNRYQFEEYWDQTTDRLICGLPASVDGHVSAEHRDYPIATGTMTISQVLDEELIEELIDSIDALGAYLGWFGGLEGEFDGVHRCSQNGVIVAPSDHADNLTVFSGVEASPETTEPRHLPTDAPELEDKIYVTLTYTEGDNLQYNQHRMRELWDDDGRGRVPINWSVSPLLIDAAPTILEYFQSTATRKDHLMCGPSGAGYMSPEPWPDDLIEEFARRTGRYMDEAQLDTMYLLNRVGDEDLMLDEQTVDAFVEHIDPRGVTYNFWPGKETVNDFESDLLQSIGPFVADRASLVDAIYSNAPDDRDGDEPAFLSIGVLAWDMTPTDIAEAVDNFGPEYEFVRGDHFFDLVEASLE